MHHLIIIGAGGYGREAFTQARQSIGYGSEFTVKGYLDNNLNALDGYEGYPSILSDVENYEIRPEDRFICAIGNVDRRKKVIQEILDKGGQFINIIHRSVRLGDNVQLGSGVFISYDVIISNDTTIEDYVLINSRAIIGHDCRISNFSLVWVSSFLAGQVTIFEDVTIQPNVSIMQGVTVEEGATVGLASVVVKDVPEGRTVFGNPGRVV